MLTEGTTGSAGIPGPPLAVSRRIAAPRAAVFAAWSNADSIRRWFSPAYFSVSEATIDFRPGGVFAVCMKAPNGQEFWSKGHYVEIVPGERIVSEANAIGLMGRPAFTARTTATFADDGGGTRLDVRQEYTVFDPMMAGALAGASEGWRTTLDKLEAEVGRR